MRVELSVNYYQVSPDISSAFIVSCHGYAWLLMNRDKHEKWTIRYLIDSHKICTLYHILFVQKLESDILPFMSKRLLNGFSLFQTYIKEIKSKVQINHLSMLGFTVPKSTLFLMFRKFLMHIVLLPRWWFGHTQRTGWRVVRIWLLLYNLRISAGVSASCTAFSRVHWMSLGVICTVLDGVRVRQCVCPTETLGLSVDSLVFFKWNLFLRYASLLVVSKVYDLSSSRYFTTAISEVFFSAT